MKLYRGGVRNEEIVNLIRFNSRIPDRVIGDMNAQISACRTGERRVAEMAERFGLDTLLEAIEEILDHGERISRARLAQLPKGSWTAADYADDDGINRDTMLKLNCTVTITDDEFIVDWTGSHPRTHGPMNLPIGLTTGVSGLAFKASRRRITRQLRPLPPAQSHRSTGYPRACPAARADLHPFGPACSCQRSS